MTADDMYTVNHLIPILAMPVTVKNPALRIIRKTGQHCHVMPSCGKRKTDIIDPERFRIEMLRHN